MILNFTAMWKKRIELERGGDKLYADVSDPPIAFHRNLNFEDAQPRAYYAEKASRKPYQFGDFIGDIKQGGSVNYFKLSLSPHGNGTHTECIAHVSERPVSITKALNGNLFLASLVSVEPKAKENGDKVVGLEEVEKAWQSLVPEALIIRTLPNSIEKVTQDYSGTNPPYLDPDIGRTCANLGIDHLLLDLPSVDREEDGGRLECHRGFWGLPHKPRDQATISELLFVPQEAEDGLYLLSIEIMPLEHNASGSRVLAWPLKKG